jgi:hypothetical protein
LAGPSSSINAVVSAASSMFFQKIGSLSKSSQF